MAETLLVLEQDGARLRSGALQAVAFARQLGDPFVILTLGDGAEQAALAAAPLGAVAVLWADGPALAEPLPELAATVIAAVAQSRGCATIAAASSTFGRDTLPRVAAVLGAPMLSDVSALERADGGVVFQRIYDAGSRRSSVALDGAVRVLTVRATAFEAATAVAQSSPVLAWTVDAGAFPRSARLLGRKRATAGRPDLSEARIVVSGGRALQDRQTFDRLIGGLADALGAAVGATRAATDAGMADAECQIGQTARTIAPQLYIAVGISGAVQHTAGMSDSKVIVAVNRDPEAPIFQLSTYGLVGDLHEIVPRLIAAARA